MSSDWLANVLGVEGQTAGLSSTMGRSAMDEAIIGLQTELSVVTSGGPEIPRLHYKLGLLLYERYNDYGKATDDLSAAVFQAATAVENADILDAAERDQMAVNLSQMVFHQWDQIRTPENAEAALERGVQTSTMLSEFSPHLPILWINLARVLLLRGRPGDRDDLEAALRYAEDAVGRQEMDDFQYPCFCFTIAEILFELSRLRSSQSDLDYAISQLLESKRTMRLDHAMQNKLHNSLGGFYAERFKYTRDDGDKAKASSYFGQWTSMPPPSTSIYEDQERPSMMHMRRFLRFGNTSDLDAAIRGTKSQIRCSVQNSPKHASLVLEVAEMFNMRFERLGKVRDIQEAIKLGKKARDLALANDIQPIKALHTLCWSLSNHNHELEVQKDVEDTIALIERTSGCITDADDQANLLSIWGMMLAQRFKQNQRNVSDLEDGMGKLREALKLSISKDQSIETLDILTNCLHDHFDRTGEEDSINEAVSRGRHLVSLLDEDHPARHRMRINLARQLTSRSLRTGNTAELDEAITIYEDVSKALPEDNFLRLRNADALAVMYDKRYERKGQISDNDKAIATLKACIDKTTPGSQERGVKCLNLGGSLARRFERTKSLTDLEEAISQYEESLKTHFTEANKDVEASSLYSMGRLQRRHYELTGGLASLDASIENGRLAVATLPETHPELASIHYVLGCSLEVRAQRTESHEDVESALDSFKTACNLRAGQPYKRIASAHRAMLILGSREEWVQAEQIADVAVSLIPRACSRKLDRDDQVHSLHDISGVPADACSISLRLGKVGKALQHVEFGRGLILGYLIDEKSDLSELRRRDSSLAQEYESLRARASTISANMDQIYHDLGECETKIRQIKGFERFLLPPSLYELQDVACDGPIVVVNTSRFGSDAIILTNRGLGAVQLPGMSVGSMINMFGGGIENQRGERDIEPERTPRLNDKVLGWLWSACVHPIFERIMTDSDLKPHDSGLCRTWWVGTGFASSLPFHAATSSDEQNPGSTLDLTIASYTSTIKALQNARYRASRGQEQGRADPYNLLVVTMPTTPGGKPLYGVTPEKQAIKTAAEGRYKITELEKPNARQVLNGMQDAQIVHFACHGASDPLDPLQSHLLLQTSDQHLDKLTVKSLMAANLQKRAWIAYLSACSTAEVSAFELKDEGLHATSAFQVAGFGHVIGSMWPVSDYVSIEVARLFYEFLSKHQTQLVSPNRVVAEALRSAVLEIRKKYPDDADVWGPYVHYGA